MQQNRSSARIRQINSVQIAEANSLIQRFPQLGGRLSSQFDDKVLPNILVLFLFRRSRKVRRRCRPDVPGCLRFMQHHNHNRI